MTMKPGWQSKDGSIRLYRADCRDVLPLVEKVATCITDPPYGIGFMGKEWDRPGQSFVERKPAKGNRFDHVGGNHNPSNSADRARTHLSENAKFQEWCREIFALVLESLLPGAMLLSFGGTRTYHRMTCAIEDAGFEIRDCLAWHYGSGFPKSLDISKAIDKADGLERPVVSIEKMPDKRSGNYHGASEKRPDIDWVRSSAASAASAAWTGYGTALKPAFEPIVLAMKPLDGTFAENAQRHGVAGLNIDAGRIQCESPRPLREAAVPMSGKGSQVYGSFEKEGSRAVGDTLVGRWPANVVMDGEAGLVLDSQTGTLESGKPAGIKAGNNNNVFGQYAGGIPATGFGDAGGASRFFYCPKADETDRRNSKHPTVKPVDLIKWLCKLTMMPGGGTVLDPFMGSGTTLEACYELHRPFIGIEREQSYFDDCVSRAKEVIGRYGLLAEVGS